MYGWGYAGTACTRVGLGQVPGPGGIGTLRPWVCCPVGGWFKCGVAIIFIAILILVALGVIF